MVNIKKPENGLRRIYWFTDREPVYNRASEDLRRIDEFTDSAQNEMTADMKVVKLSETNSSSEEAVLVEEEAPPIPGSGFSDRARSARRRKAARRAAGKSIRGRA